MNNNFSYVQKIKSNKITSLHNYLQINIFEEIRHESTEITIRGSMAESNKDRKLQLEYIQGFWEYTLLDFFGPKKKFLKEFYISVDTKISHMKFFNWSISKNDRGDVTHLVIESVIPPDGDYISHCDYVTKLGDNYIYQFNVQQLGKIIFTEKPPL